MYSWRWPDQYAQATTWFCLLWINNLKLLFYCLIDVYGGTKGGSVLPLKMGCIPVMMAEGIYNERSEPGYCNEYHSYVRVMNVKNTLVVEDIMIQSLRMKGFTGLCICIQTNSQFKDEKWSPNDSKFKNERFKWSLHLHSNQFPIQGRMIKTIS